MILVFLLTESCEIKYTINKWIWRNNMFKKGKRLAANVIKLSEFLNL